MRVLLFLSLTASILCDKCAFMEVCLPACAKALPVDAQGRAINCKDYCAEEWTRHAAQCSAHGVVSMVGGLR